MTPSQYNAWLRQQQQRYNDAVRRHNAEVDRVNRHNRAVLEANNREIERVNRANAENVRRFNQQVETNNRARTQAAKTAISDINRALQKVASRQSVTRVPLSNIPGLVRDLPPSATPSADETYDVFISHASEDKDEIVRDLAHALSTRGLKVWYDEFALRIGDSLRQKIDRGLANSRFGIVVLSEAFFKKGWANYELDGIVSRSLSGQQQLLPIWHKVSKDDVMKYSPSIVDKVARSTLEFTVNEISKEICDLIRGTS